MVTTEATSARHFPMYWMSDLKNIIGFDFDDLALDKQEVVQVLN